MTKKTSFLHSGKDPGYLWLFLPPVRIIFMTKVGYGDLIPSTLFGRTFCVVCCFLGSFINAFLIIVSENQLAFSDSESAAYTKMLVNQDRKKLDNLSEHMLASSIYFMYLRKKAMNAPLPHKKKEKMLFDVIYYAKMFKRYRV